MKAQELRVGNIVEYLIRDEMDAKKEWWEPSQIDAQDILWLSQNPDDEDYRPIPLTEEWLVGFGFVVNESATTKYVYKQIMATCYISFQMHNDAVYLCIEPPKNDYESDECCEQVDIKYVHTLQNFVYAISGEEITTKTPIQ